MARKEKKYHFIYKTTNLLSGRYYIGMHSTDDLDDGYLGSGTRIRRAINKYGEENFKREILEFCKTRKELKSREKEIVNLNEIAKIDCMNLKVGGTGGFSSEQQKLNAIKSNERQKWLRENNPEWFEKLCENRSKGNKRAYEEGKREKYYFHDWNGKEHSEETKKKMSQSKKGKGKGSNNSQFGKCWITNEKENKKIMRGDLIPDGWRLGRVMKK